MLNIPMLEMVPQLVQTQWCSLLILEMLGARERDASSQIFAKPSTNHKLISNRTAMYEWEYWKTVTVIGRNIEHKQGKKCMKGKKKELRH